MIITRDVLESYPSRYRAQLINSISGFKSANLIGTLSAKSISNLAIFNSVVHIGASPALLGFILRPHTVERHTYENIIDSGYYTLNHVNNDIIDESHQTSAKYKREISEFEAVGFQEEYQDGFTAPFVKEANIKLGMKFERDIKIDLNDTRLIIGSVQTIDLRKEYLQEDGSVDLNASESVAITGLDTYHETKKIKKLPYAKP